MRARVVGALLITVTAGLGGMGGAQPLAIKLTGGVSICVEVDIDKKRVVIDPPEGLLDF